MQCRAAFDAQKRKIKKLKDDERDNLLPLSKRPRETDDASENATKQSEKNKSNLSKLVRRNKDKQSSNSNEPESSSSGLGLLSMYDNSSTSDSD